MKREGVFKKIREVCTIKPPKKLAYNKLKESDEVTFLPMKDVNEYNYYIKPLEKKKLKDVYKSYTYFENNDVLLAKITPCFENGKLGIAKNLVNGVGFGSSEYIVLRPDKELKSEYLYYYLCLDYIRKIGKKRMLGAVGHKRIPIDYIANLKLYIPKYFEQERIVKILDSAFAEIDKAKANIEKNIANAEELFQSKLDEVFSQRGEGWVEKKLGDICEKTKNIKWNKTKLKYQYIDLTSVSRETLRIENTHKINSENAPSRAKKIIKADDVIFATTRPTLKRVAIIDEDFDNQICSTGFAVLRALNESVISKILFYYLQTSYFMTCMEKMQRGASYPAVTDKEVKNQTICIPSLPEQERIVRALDAVFDEKEELKVKYNRNLIESEELKKSILEKAFEGGW